MMKTMMQNWAKYAAVALLFAIPCITSCSDDDDCPGEGSGGGQISLPSATVAQIPVAAIAGELTLAVNFGADWELALEKTVSWLDVNPKKGTAGVQNLTLTLQDNPLFENQTTEITFTIGGQEAKLKVVQEPAVRSIRVYENQITLSEDTTEVQLQRVITNLPAIEVVKFPAWIESVVLIPVTEGAFTAQIKMKPGAFDTDPLTDAITFKDAATDFSVDIPVKLQSPIEGYSFVSCPEEVLGYDIEGKLGNISVQLSVAPGKDMKVVCFDYIGREGQFLGGKSYYAGEPVKKPAGKAAFEYETWEIPVVCDPGEFMYNSELNEDEPTNIQFGVFVVKADEDLAAFDPNKEGLKYRLVTVKPFDKANLVVFKNVVGGEVRKVDDHTYSASFGIENAELKVIFKAVGKIKVILGERDYELVQSEDECGYKPSTIFTLEAGAVTPDADGLYTTYEYTVHLPAWTDFGPMDWQRSVSFQVYEQTADGKFIVTETVDSYDGSTTREVIPNAKINIKQVIPDDVE